jgi:hypothetical protein
MFLICCVLVEFFGLNIKMELPLPLYKKLNVTFRVEPGCLGPNGIEYVDGFCKYAKSAIAKIDSDFVRCTIIPRHDKSLPETEYKTNGKALTQEKAALFLPVFGKALDDFEEELEGKLAELIDEYLGRK